jgi:hypothetical protein
VSARFDPAAHPPLVALRDGLPDLAGAAAHQAGRDYLRKGLVQQGVVAGASAYATVTGSTSYRVTVAWPDEVKVTCTCPAHRRSRYCKHVVAVCTALLEQPASFAVSDAPPEPPAPKPARRRKASADTAAPVQRAELRAAGLETVDRLLAELADGGLASLGPDKVALLEGAGELVRALKLRRLGNQVLALQRAAAPPTSRLPASAQAAASLPAYRAAAAPQVAPSGLSAVLEPSTFARLLVDLYLTRQAASAHLEGRAVLDPGLAEDLLGKTWRDADLEPAAGLEMLELAYTQDDDGEFRIQTSYLADLPTGAIYAERQISPGGRSSPPKPSHRHRLLVDEAGLYPGVPPRRIRLRRVQRLPLTAADVDRLVARAADAVPELQRQLAERLETPFGAPTSLTGPVAVPVLFRPAALVAHGSLIGALDGSGRFLALEWPLRWTHALPQILPESAPYVLFGLLALGPTGLRLRCLSAVSSALRWGHGPIFADER